jgi:hypothetical protein
MKESLLISSRGLKTFLSPIMANKRKKVATVPKAKETHTKEIINAHKRTEDNYET